MSLRKTLSREFLYLAAVWSKKKQIAKKNLTKLEVVSIRGIVILYGYVIYK